MRKNGLRNLPTMEQPYEKCLENGWNVTADEVLLSRLTNYLGESSVKVIEKPIESVH